MLNRMPAPPLHLPVQAFARPGLVSHVMVFLKANPRGILPQLHLAVLCIHARFILNLFICQQAQGQQHL